MASKFGKLNPETNEWEGTADIVRQHDIEGYEVKMVISADGISITRKGDKHKEKPTLKGSWTDILEIFAARQKERGELEHDGKEYNGAYDFLGFE